MHHTAFNLQAENWLIATVRKLVLVVFLFGLAGTGAELVLLEHMEDAWMWPPLVLMALSLLVLLGYAVSKARQVLRMFQGVMMLFVASGLLGVWLHYKGNVEFELEMYPTMAGFKLFWEAMKGATPALAPGTMIQLGLLGGIFTYKHPRLSRNTGEGPRMVV